MAIYKVCPYCGFRNEPTASDCQSCDADLVTVALTEVEEETQPKQEQTETRSPQMGRRCRCGTLSALGVQTCPSCGQNLSSMPLVQMMDSGTSQTAPAEKPADTAGWSFQLIGTAVLFRIRDGERITVGAAERWREALSNYPFVSRSHADLAVRNGRLFITDHSTNGTQLNFRLIPKNQETEIPDNAVLGLGGRAEERQMNAAYFQVRKEG